MRSSWLKYTVVLDSQGSLKAFKATMSIMHTVAQNTHLHTHLSLSLSFSLSLSAPLSVPPSNMQCIVMDYSILDHRLHYPSNQFPCVVCNRLHMHALAGVARRFPPTPCMRDNNYDTLYIIIREGKWLNINLHNAYLEVSWYACQNNHSCQGI